MLTKVLRQRSLSSSFAKGVSCYASNSVLSAKNAIPAGIVSQRLSVPEKQRYFSTASEAATTKSESSAQTLEFQAETRKLLDIVTHSIYTDKEVFLRELISNASDALEKFRYFQSTGTIQLDPNAQTQPLEINIITDSANNTLTLIDSGVGMSREELISNLGTIARSGSKQFVEQLSNGKGETAGSKEGIIGQFGVGFYSSFMVAESVSVESVSAQTSNTSATSTAPSKWSSDGSGVFQVESLPAIEGVPSHGSRITMKLKDDCKEFSDPERIKNIIKHYSQFVSFPIKVNGEHVNTVGAIWLKDKKELTESQYREFYQFTVNKFDNPQFTLHFRTDAPIDLKCILFVPQFHSEKLGMGAIEPSVNLYSRKVLIEAKAKDLLPDWLRFLKGVVDSEDLPLSISREKPQDSNLLKRIRDVLTRKFLKFLDDEMKNNFDKYKDFFLEYHMFLKQGICHDYKYVDNLAKLLLFETSAFPDKYVTFDDYISRMAPEQKEIYYLVAPNRAAALSSPYYETFKKHNREVLLLYNTIDDFVMANVKAYSGRTLISAESTSIQFDDAKTAETENKSETAAADQQKKKLTDEESKDLCAWLQIALGANKLREAKVTHRLSDSPAIVTDHQSGALRRMIRMVEQMNDKSAQQDVLPPQQLEINPSHPIIVSLHQMKDNPNSVAKLVAEQLYDNALMAAGLLDDPRVMLPRLNDILLNSLKSTSSPSAPAASYSSGADVVKPVVEAEVLPPPN